LLKLKAKLLTGFIKVGLEFKSVAAKSDMVRDSLALSGEAQLLGADSFQWMLDVPHDVGMGSTLLIDVRAYFRTLP
jgi:hypothetical protein